MVDYILLEKYANKLNVLLVDDDDESIQNEMGELLNEIFNIVDIASNGEDALYMYENFRIKNQKFYDIVISDVSMPKLDGVRLSELILEANPIQEIVIISAYSDPKDLIEFINLGVSQFITKPVEINKFITILFKISEKLNILKTISVENSKNLISLSNDLYWNFDTKKLTRKKEILKLTKKEMLLIDLLVQVKDKTFESDDIIEYLWKDSSENADVSNLKNVVSRLKKKIPDLKIESVYGLGYKLIIN